MEKYFYEEYFNLESSHWWFLGRREIIHAFLGTYLSGDQTKKILDVGCGTGQDLKSFGIFGKTFGVDLSSESIKFCKKRDLRDLVHALGQKLPFKNEMFDVVCALDLLEHLEDDEAVLAEIHRVLKLNGLLILTVPAFQFLWGSQDEINMHRRRYVLKDIKRKIESGNFNIEKISYFNTILFGFAALVRVFRKIWRPIPGKSDKVISDNRMTGEGMINTALTKIFAFEKHLLKNLNFPFGVSIIAVSRKR